MNLLNENDLMDLINLRHFKTFSRDIIVNSIIFNEEYHVFSKKRYNYKVRILLVGI